MKKAFTMAEILLSLTIIGVVAAITLPSLTGNINERTWNTQRKALYARFSQAMALMPALNGYGTLTEDEEGNITADTAAETFVTEGLAKVLKMNNICDSDHLADCGIASSFTDISGTQKNTPKTLYDLNPHFQNANWDGASFSITNTKSVAFETANGESVIVYYNPQCRTEYQTLETPDRYGRFMNLAQTVMCANFIYDLNGSKGPNTLGKDIGFMTAFYATDTDLVAPHPVYKIANSGAKTELSSALSTCRAIDNDMRLPNINEISSLTLNNTLTGLKNLDDFWSGSKYSATQAWCQDTEADIRFISKSDDKFKVLCIKR